MEFINRRSKTTSLKIGDSHRDYPIGGEYKYLGTWLSHKLDLEPQIQFINKKVNFMKPMPFRAGTDTMIYNDLQ